MLKDITIGQYFQGDSFIHRLDARTKILIAIAYIVAIFVADNFIGFGLLAAFLVLVIAVSGIGFKPVLKSLKPIIFLVVFTGLINVFFTQGEPLLKIWILKITKEGLIAAAKMICRIIILVAGTSLLTYTTSPLELTDAIERLLAPLKKIKLPVHELAMMTTIALRFIPTLVEETEKIMNAQRARGADFDSGNLVTRIKALVPVLVPMFISSFRRADDLALAMECRCYNSGVGKTKMTVTRFTHRDFIGAFIAVAFMAAAIAIKFVF